jgi:hypothetical protein
MAKQLSKLSGKVNKDFAWSRVFVLRSTKPEDIIIKTQIAAFLHGYFFQLHEIHTKFHETCLTGSKSFLKAGMHISKGTEVPNTVHVALFLCAK